MVPSSVGFEFKFGCLAKERVRERREQSKKPIAEPIAPVLFFVLTFYRRLCHHTLCFCRFVWLHGLIPYLGFARRGGVEKYRSLWNWAEAGDEKEEEAEGQEMRKRRRRRIRSRREEEEREEGE